MEANLTSVDTSGTSSPGSTGVTASLSAAMTLPLDTSLKATSSTSHSAKDKAACSQSAKEKAASAPVCAFCNEGEDSDDADDDPIIDTKHSVGCKSIFAHEQCLDWTGDIWQDEAYDWVNVGKSLARSRKLKCAKCGEHGASLGCKRTACTKSWHVPCAFEPSEKLVIFEDDNMVACASCARTLEKEKEERLRHELEKGQAPPPKKAKSGDAGSSGGGGAAEAARRAQMAEAEVAKLKRELDAVRARSKPHIENKIRARKERDEALSQLAAREQSMAEQDSESVAAAREEARAAKTEAEAAMAELEEARAHLRAARGEAEALAAMPYAEVERLVQLNAAAQLKMLERCEALRKREEREHVDRTSCAVCLTEARSIAFAPCGHVACCKGCAPKLDACPLCKKGIAQRVAIFLP